MVSTGKVKFIMPHMDLWYWLINHGVSRHEIDRKPTTFLFDLYMKKKQISNKWKKGYIGSWQKAILASESISRLEPVCRLRTP